MKIETHRQLGVIRHLAALLSLVCMSLAAGCGTGVGNDTAGVGVGGTGTGSGGGTGIILYALAGKVADGYLVNATVFLDKNGNYRLDAGEPSAITGQNGAYKLDVAPEDVGRYPIVALALKGVTIDLDTNLPVTHSYVLSMPKESINGIAANFISPISSQLREMMETGAYASVHQAAEILKARMGLPADTNLQADYVAARNRDIHAAAQNMAALMGNQMAHVLAADASTVTVDVKRYRSMMAAINKNVSAVAEGASQELARKITQETLASSGP